MKKDTTHSALLGLTQLEMAMFLKVHSSQWSMYESGQRELPLQSKQLLGEMLGYLQVKDQSQKIKLHTTQQEELKNLFAATQLQENTYQMAKIGKKIKLAEIKYHRNLSVIGLMEYLQNHPSAKEKLNDELLESMKLKAEAALRKSGLAELTQLKIKQALLQQEQVLLQAELKK